MSKLLGRLSQSALQRGAVPLDELIDSASDVQSNAAVVVLQQRTETHKELTDLLAPLDVPPEQVGELAQLCTEIKRHVREGIEAGIRIGEKLLRAKSILGSNASAFEEFCGRDEACGFGSSAALRYMRVAEFWRERRFHRILKNDDLTLDALPSVYACYELTTLSDRELVIAAKDNLINPKITVDEIRAFKKVLSHSKTADKTVSLLTISRQEGKLRQKAQRLREQLALVEQELADVARIRTEMKERYDAVADEEVPHLQIDGTAEEIKSSEAA